MVILANQPPQLVYIRTRLPAAISATAFPDCHSRPPHLSGGGGVNLRNTLYFKTLFSRNAACSVPCACPDRIVWSRETGQAPSLQKTFLALTELEALTGALLSVLLSLFSARITGHHALSLERLAQFGIKQHQSAGDPKTHRISLSGDSAARNVSKHIEAGRGLGERER